VNVPTDVVPFYDASSAPQSDLESAEFTLTSAPGDTLTAQPARAQLNTTELTIERALQPNTTYTLVAKLSKPSGPDYVESLSLTFTTGAGPVSAPPAPPQGFLRHYRFAEPPHSSCGPWEEGTCVALTAGLPVEEIEVDEFGQDDQWTYLRREPWFIDLTGINQGTNFRCVKLRTRAPNAVYSSPLVLCGADAPLFTLRGSTNIECTAQGLTQDGALVTNSAGAANPSPTASDGAAQGGAAGSPTKNTEDDLAAFGKPAGAAQEPTSSSSTSCALASASKHSPNAALGGLCVWALAACFRRLRRRA